MFIKENSTTVNLTFDPFWIKNNMDRVIQGINAKVYDKQTVRKKTISY